jgi:hypothetical protein
VITTTTFGRCWIVVRWSTLQIIFFYVPLWCSFLFNLIVYILTGYKVIKAFRKLRNIKTPEGKKLDKKRKIAYMRTVSGYLGNILSVSDCVIVFVFVFVCMYLLILKLSFVLNSYFFQWRSFWRGFGEVSTEHKIGRTLARTFSTLSSSTVSISFF